MDLAVPNPLATPTDYLHAYRTATQYITCTLKLKGAQLAAALCVLNKTFGWNKVSDVISTSQFVKATRYAEETVIKALQALRSAGIVGRIEEGDSFRYWLRLPDLTVFNIRHSAVDNPTTDDRRPMTDVDNPTPNSQQPVSPSTASIPASPPASPQSASEPLGKTDTHSLRYENKLKDKETKRKIVENTAMLLDINHAAIQQGCYPLANFRWLAEQALDMGFTDGFMWHVWEKCCAVADKPIALFLAILDGKAEIPTVPRPKRPERARRPREEERDYFPHDAESRRQRQARVASGGKFVGAISG
jgi:hypothetical protein